MIDLSYFLYLYIEFMCDSGTFIYLFIQWYSSNVIGSFRPHK